MPLKLLNWCGFDLNSLQKGANPFWQHVPYSRFFDSSFLAASSTTKNIETCSQKRVLKISGVQCLQENKTYRTLRRLVHQIQSRRWWEEPHHAHGRQPCQFLADSLSLLACWKAKNISINFHKSTYANEAYWRFTPKAWSMWHLHRPVQGPVPKATWCFLERWQQKPDVLICPSIHRLFERMTLESCNRQKGRVCTHICILYVHKSLLQCESFIAFPFTSSDQTHFQGGPACCRRCRW